jgi:hypothetical protein
VSSEPVVATCKVVANPNVYIKIVLIDNLCNDFIKNSFVQPNLLIIPQTKNPTNVGLDV